MREKNVIVFNWFLGHSSWTPLNPKDEEKNKTVCRTMYWKCEIKCRFFLRSRKECVFVFVFIACLCVCASHFLCFPRSLSVFISFPARAQNNQQSETGLCILCVYWGLSSYAHTYSLTPYFSLFIFGSVSIAHMPSIRATHRHMNCAISCSLVTYAWTGCAHCVCTLCTVYKL